MWKRYLFYMVTLSFSIQWDFKDKWNYCKSISPQTTGGLVGQGLPNEHTSASLCWSMQACKVCITNTAVGLMEQLINGRLVYPAEWLISHLQQSLTPEHQSTQQQSEWLWTCLAWAAKDLMATSFLQPAPINRRGGCGRCNTGGAENRLNTSRVENRGVKL